MEIGCWTCSFSLIFKVDSTESSANFRVIVSGITEEADVIRAPIVHHGRGGRVPVAHAHRRPLPRGAQLEEARAAHRRPGPPPRQHAPDHGW